MWGNCCCNPSLAMMPSSKKCPASFAWKIIKGVCKKGEAQSWANWSCVSSSCTGGFLKGLEVLRFLKNWLLKFTKNHSVFFYHICSQPVFSLPLRVIISLWRFSWSKSCCSLLLVTRCKHHAGIFKCFGSPYSASVRNEAEQRRLLHTAVLVQMRNSHSAYMHLILHHNFQRGLVLCAGIRLPL